ncbi:phage tail protein [Citrobacter amalonaticus]|uniref:gp53-like domain-containing protein n=1 Tax=Citrobacter amalonaticus TaxID=35703 RepID=UPI0021E33F57|nr:phage tail protein [Citrobacter amalonaticus]UYF54574.1 phage tail protein [Citrobacter amalonaticus]
MATNNFKPFATAANANVTAQADWEALPALLSGFMAGKASSAQVNKAIRQASFIAAALAQYTANKSGLDVLDDGDLNGFISKMGTAFGKDFQALDATLTALAGLATGANKLPYFTGNDTAAQTDLTSVGRDIIGKSTIADILTYLGLGTAAKLDVGTGENQIPDMSAWVSGDGWRRTPDGYIEQWGTLLQDSNVTQTLLFPIPFLNKVENICLTETTQSTSTSNVSAWGFNKDTLTLSSVTVINSKTNTGEWLYWRAIGK